MCFAEKMLLNRYLPIMVSTPATKHFIYRDVVFLRPLFKLAHCLRVFMGQKEGTIEAIQSAGRGHLKAIHNGLSFNTDPDCAFLSCYQQKLKWLPSHEPEAGLLVRSGNI